MARYDKYEPKAGGFRGPLHADTPATSIITAINTTGMPVGVGLDVDGHVVVGQGQTGILGVLCTTKNMLAGEIVDVMTAGEVVDLDEAGDQVPAGTVLTADDVTGVIDDTPPGAGQTIVGWTVEKTRLVVRVCICGAGGNRQPIG